MFERGDVTVDDRFARFGGKSFAINKINSVEVRTSTAPGSWTYILWWLFTVLLGVGVVSGQHWEALLVVGFLAWMGWRSWQRRHPVTTYRLFLVTSSAEAQAFQTNDVSEVEGLRNAIEDAMARSS